MLSLVAYANKPRTVTHLKDNITRVILEIEPQLCEKIIENWINRIYATKRSRGGHLRDYFFPYIMPLNVLSHDIKISTISHIHFVLFQFKDLPCLLENPVIVNLCLDFFLIMSNVSELLNVVFSIFIIKI